MPGFASPKESFSFDKKMTKEELIRAMRFFVSAEYEAVQMYMQIAEVSDNELVKEALISISEEELVHVGEFLELINELDPSEKEFYQEGRQEIGDMRGSNNED